MKIAILYKNPLGHLTQWGAKSDTCEKIFVYSPNGAVAKVKKINPDFIFVNKQFDMGVVKELVGHGYPLAYFYGDYRQQLGQQFMEFCQMAKIVLLTWYRKDIFNKFNAFRISQGINQRQWHPIWESPELYDVAFSGNRSGPGGKRLEILKRLDSDFKLMVIGAGWSGFKHHIPKKGPENTNKYLSLAKTNVGIFNFEDLTNLDYYTSNRLYQGMATGKPHIGPYTKKLASCFRDEDCYLEWRNYSELKDIISRLVSDPVERRRVGEAQHDAIMRKYTTQHMWKRIENIIHNIKKKS